MGRAGCSGKVLWMPTACSAKGLPRGLAETVLSRLRAEALQNGSTETRLVFSGNKPLQPFLGWGCRKTSVFLSRETGKYSFLF